MKNFISVICFSITTTLYAQVGINTPTPKATLDMNKSATSQPEGFLTVRLSGTDLASRDNLYGADQNAAVVYVTAAPSTSTSKTSNVTTPGFYYYNNGISKWVGLTMPKFFYMPSILFDTTSLGAKTKDLYQLYYDQFTTPQASSTGAAGKIPVLGKNDLEYYITYYDTNVFTNVSIDANGLMSYTVSNNATDASFMNIVFVVK
ncbi:MULTISPECIES: hypothetical protein [Chryseobacterium]|uniref:Uncharacterized protein n=1 Tax=Chryseobacterium camelliae TaxID=1265445 RepID=A0ABU0TED0_9FLAO|nr:MULTISPECIES: hypothetical protein [Chryseobacterium]MDT3406781.1 hypothetical protein [Pseudacidovorax intermedius]MDQ1095423.1 hypothetical protein [Chryseobacterium camelliae]MDQ1099363.1 hypothetical protein [Chryseobacterium sp. SORGH_AS_1048]MDR6086709.1 hypothetical protein [Chryseobacterium sp. SORGH_AS_0909]MDR6131081.1 hypothetical protein [Chryseobacterium sp. SORGH_AS_1175]